MPRSDYATCFFFFQKTFVFRKPNTPRVTAAQKVCHKPQVSHPRCLVVT